MHSSIWLDQSHYTHNVTHQKTENFLLHTHETYEIYYFISGDVHYLIEGQAYALAPHTILLIPPNLFHGVRVHTNATYERHTLHFDPNILSLERRVMLLSFFPIAPQKGRETMPYRMENMEHSGILSMMRALEACAEQDERVQKILLPVWTEAILGTLLLCTPPRENGDAMRESGRVSRMQREMIEYLNAHFTENITLDALSEKFFISKHYLNRVFRKATGTTVLDYLIHKRVSYVQQMLINGVSASQAAAMAGFGDYTSFYRAYVKRFGYAPSHERVDRANSYERDIFHARGVLRDQARNGSLYIEETDGVFDGLMDDNVRFWQERANKPLRLDAQGNGEEQREERQSEE